MNTALVTGGSGFLGRLLVERLLASGWRAINIDLQPLDLKHENLVSFVGDIRSEADMLRAFSSGPVNTIFHCAAQLAHGAMDKNFLWTCNVDGTGQVAEHAARHKVPKVIYISSNCLWGEPFGRPVREDDEPRPIELYGRSKLEGEHLLAKRSGDFDAVIIRSPTIMDAGRLGLLSILFEFIDEGRRVWVVGDGGNRYQFIYAQDLIQAMLLAAESSGTHILNIGSDDPKPLRETYQYVIDASNSGARVASLPKAATLAAMKLAYRLGVSPLGPYHYKMIAEDFTFDTTKIKNKLNWRPTLANHEMLLRAYEYYRSHKSEIYARDNVSTHRSAAKLGIIRLLKWAS